VQLAAEDAGAADDAARELDELASGHPNEVLTALSARARGCICLSKGDAQGALGPLRRAFFVWQGIGAPYLEACLQAELANAFESLGDREGAELSRAAARRVFERLEARVALSALGGGSGADEAPATGLSPRELEVLRLVASGKTNKEVAAGLQLSERTVDRHVANIFRKLNVATRAAATAMAYKQGWVGD
jgi:DNA-binding NarL/FixJ family response regulator